MKLILTFIIPNFPTSQIEHNANDNETTSIQRDSSLIGAQNTTTIQPQTFPQQVTRSYGPPSIPPQFSPHTTPHNFPQQGSSNMHIVQHVPQTQSQQITLRTPPYTPAQTSYTTVNFYYNYNPY